jgi:hypothetical protein
MEKFRILYDLKAAERVCVAQCTIAPDIEQRLARMPVCTVYNISQAIPSCALWRIHVLVTVSVQCHPLTTPTPSLPPNAQRSEAEYMNV